VQQFRCLIDSVLGGAVEVFSSRRRRVRDHRPSIGALGVGDGAELGSRPDDCSAAK
jgi:hypothetical protein